MPTPLIYEIPKPSENRELALKVTSFILEGLNYHNTQKQGDLSESEIAKAEDQITVAAIDGNGEVLGAACLRPNRLREGNITGIAVLKEHRRSKLGSAIIGTMESIARDRGLEKLIVIPQNEGVIRFFSSMFYRRNIEEPREYLKLLRPKKSY